MVHSTNSKRSKYSIDLHLTVAPMAHIHCQLSLVDKNAQTHSYLQTSYSLLG